MLEDHFEDRQKCCELSVLCVAFFQTYNEKSIQSLPPIISEDDDLVDVDALEQSARIAREGIIINRLD